MRSGILRGCFLSMVTLLAAGLIAAALWFGVVSYVDTQGLLATPPPRPATMAVATAVPPRPTRPPTAATVALPAPTPARPPTTTGVGGDTELVRLTDSELTQALRQAVAQEQGGVLITNAAVRVAGGAIELTGQLRGIVPLPVDVRAMGRVDVRDGQPVVVVDRVEGVGLPLPAAAARRLELLINSVSLVPLPPGIEVTRVVPGDGVLTVYGRRR